MTTISKIGAAVKNFSFKKAAKPQPAELDEVGKFLTSRNVFSTQPQDAVRSAKASAAFFNAQKMMTKSNGEKVVKDSSKLKNIFVSLKDQTAKSVNKIKDTKVGSKLASEFHSVSNGTKKFFSMPAVKKGLKFGAIAALVLGALYLGKKGYDAYKNRKSASETTPNPTPAVPSGSVEVKKGDNVWNIAKEDLGGKASNADIAKRTEEIMKLNNLEYANDKGLVIIKPGDQIKLNA